VQAALIYDLNRNNDHGFTDDQTDVGRASLPVTVR